MQKPLDKGAFCCYFCHDKNKQNKKAKTMKKIMQKLDVHQKYMVNPAYKFKEDYNNVIITNNNSARYIVDYCRKDITYSFAWRVHPDLAFMFGFFDGSKTLDEVATRFSLVEKIDKDFFVNLVSPCINNSEEVMIPTSDGSWALIPKNFLIPNTMGVARDYLLEKIDLPFIRKFYSLSEVRLRVPNSMTFMLNTTCVTDCVYCYADRPQIKHPLPFARIKTLLKEAFDLEMPYIEVDGGDFFLYPHWRELLAEMLKYDYLPNISTKFPLTERMVNDLKTLGVKHIQLSIDSVNSKEMQKILMVGEQYTELILHGLRLLDKAGFEITVKPVITKFNDSEESLNHTINVLTSFSNVRRVNFTPAGFSQFRPPTYYSTSSQLTRLKTIVDQRNGDCDAHLSFLDYEEYQSVEQRAQSFSNRPICTGNVHGFFVLPDGKVTICEQMYWHPFFILGDLNKQSIMEMWDSELALSKWKFSQDEVRDVSPCKMCEEFEACRRGLGNCWRQAISAYGPENYDFPAPNCPKAPPITKEFYIP